MGSSGAERERGAIRAGQDPRCRSTAPPRPHSFGCKILSTHTDIAAVTFSAAAICSGVVFRFIVAGPSRRSQLRMSRSLVCTQVMSVHAHATSRKLSSFARIAAASSGAEPLPLPLPLPATGGGSDEPLPAPADFFDEHAASTSTAISATRRAIAKL